MAQMELVPFNNPSNVDIYNAIRNTDMSQFQSRVPAATKANLNASVDAMWNYGPARNQFIDSLVNLIGMQILKYNTWTNPLAKFKRGMLNFGETIEETALGILQAHAYNPDAEYLEKMLFGREPNEVQSRWHKINRQEFYKLTINRNLLRRAFLNDGGVSSLISGLMTQLNTSDNLDEFLQTASLFRTYYDEGGFFEVAVPDVNSLSATSDDAKQFLKVVRAYANKLPFISREYNAARMPVRAEPGQLELFLTPEAQANVDVEGLAAAFNIDKMNITSRTTIVPQENFNIPGCQGILTTREFFIIADQFFDMEQMPNPVGGYTNYFWHHHEVLSASPFVPAILLTSTGGTVITVLDYVINGVGHFTVSDLVDGTTETVTDGTGTAADTVTVTRGDGYLVSNLATTTVAGAPDTVTGVTLSIKGQQSGRTYITQQGVFVVGYDEVSTSITITAEATKDNTFKRDLTVTVTGPLVEGSIGQHIDEDGTPTGPTAG